MADSLYRKTSQINLVKGLNKSGFTLIEVLVASVIFVLVVNVAYGLLFTSLSSYFRLSNESDVLAQSRIAMNRMEREVREARWLTSNTSSSVLKFRLPKHMTESDKAIPITYSRDKIISYYVKDGQLLRRIYDIPVTGFDGTSPNRGDPVVHFNEGVNIIARNIESLELTYLPAETPDNSYKTAVRISIRGQAPASKPLLLISTVQVRAQRGW